MNVRSNSGTMSNAHQAEAAEQGNVTTEVPIQMGKGPMFIIVIFIVALGAGTMTYRAATDHKTEQMAPSTPKNSGIERAEKKASNENQPEPFRSTGVSRD